MSYDSTKVNQAGSTYDSTDTQTIWAEDWNAFVLAYKNTASPKHYIHIPAKDWTVNLPYTVGGTDADFQTEVLSNGIERVYLGYDHTQTLTAYTTIDLPEDWDGGNLTVIIDWETANASLNTCQMLLYGARIADGTTSNVSLSLLKTVLDTNTGAGYLNKTTESTAFTITGTGNKISLKLVRDYTNDTVADVIKILGVTIKCIRNLV
jgi:hypothetical protein